MTSDIIRTDLRSTDRKLRSLKFFLHYYSDFNINITKTFLILYIASKFIFLTVVKENKISKTIYTFLWK